jgi:molybdopterin/thiamine biosynthesis adenylyltransferase/proteasome lid subunit RPN8/RPN11
MSVTLAFRQEHWSSLLAACDMPTESAAVLALGLADTGDDLTLLVRDVAWVPSKGYSARERDRLEITSSGWMPAVGRAAAAGAAAGFLHTHPGRSPAPSAADHHVDELLAEPFLLRTGQPFYVSVVFGGSSVAPSFTASVTSVEGISRPVTKLRVIGDRLRVLTPVASPGPEPSDPGMTDLEMFDRQIRAFGHSGQRVLNGLHAGVVGAGGTGSAVAEQLVRLGVGTLTVLDNDAVAVTNLTRIHGSGRADVGLPKTALVARVAQEVGTSSVHGIPFALRDETTVRHLVHCDVIFGCTDDQRGRGILNRLAYYYLIPVLDTGFVISSQDGHITGLDGRVTTVAPGMACLLCRGRIDPAAIRVEALSAQERAALAAEGYAPELGEPDPSVITYTTMVGSLAVHEMLARLFGFTGDAPASSELLLRGHANQIRSNTVTGQPGHFCTDPSAWGRGDTEPLLDQVWT